MVKPAMPCGAMISPVASGEKCRTLLHVEREHEQLAAVPHAEQEGQRRAVAQAGAEQQAGPDERRGMARLRHHEAGGGADRDHRRAKDER